MKKSKIFGIVLLTVFFAFTLTACSPSTGTGNEAPREKGSETSNGEMSKAAKDLEPEALISQAEAEALTGLKVDSSSKSEESAVGLKLIAYNLLGDALLQVSFNHMEGKAIKNLYDGTKELYDGCMDLNDLGDEAYRCDSGMLGSWVCVLRGEYMITICAQNMDKADEKAISAATLALENLEKHLK